MGDEPDKLDEFLEKYEDSERVFVIELKRISPPSRIRYPIPSALDLLKETTTNSNSLSVLYTGEAG